MNIFAAENDKSRDNNIFYISELFAKTTMTNIDHITRALEQIIANRRKDPSYSAHLRLWQHIFQHKEADRLPTLEINVEIINIRNPQPDDSSENRTTSDISGSDVLTTLDDVLTVSESDTSGIFLKKFLMILSFFSRGMQYTGFVVDGVMWKDGRVSIIMSA